ncbi:hypothetical protein Tco_0420885 [Tanacetum coccineum]
MLCRSTLKELSTIPKKDKSSVEDLVPIPSGSKGVSDDIYDHFDAESLLRRVNYDQSTKESDDESYENIEYVEASSLNLEYGRCLEDFFEIEPDQEGLTGVVISDNSNDPLLELPEFESFHFDFDPSFPHPPPEPPDVKISLIIEEVCK